MSVPLTSKRIMLIAVALILVLVVMLLCVVFTSIAYFSIMEDRISTCREISWVSSKCAGKIGDLDVVVECELPKAPSKVARLRIIKENITVEEAVLIARKVFNAKGPLKITSHRDPSGLREVIITWRDSGHESFLGITGSHVLIYFEHSSMPRYPRIPSEEEAKEIASELLAELDKFMPRPSKLELEYLGVEEGEVDVWLFSNGTRKRVVLSLAVRYSAKIHGVRLWGPDAGIRICIADGRVVSADVRYIKVKEEGFFNIVSPSEALRRFVEGRWYHVAPRAPFTDVESGVLRVKRIELVYYSSLLNDYLIPCYLFDCRVEGKINGKPYRESFKVLVPAINGLT